MIAKTEENNGWSYWTTRRIAEGASIHLRVCLCVFNCSKGLSGQINDDHDYHTEALWSGSTSHT